ncbi:MAG: hypothetical protein J6J33_02420, partial [Clostridia bacterium]|nr:hypothetical protein [Clostridia bacterium]
NSVTLFKEIVHNKNVNNKLKQKGVMFAETKEELSPNSTAIIRAHGEPPETYEYLNTKGIPFIDCTCINVKKIHEEVKKYSEDGYTIAILGKFDEETGVIHPEVEGTIGWCKTPPILISKKEHITKLDSVTGKLYVVCQTTFNEKKADEILDQIVYRYNSKLEIVTNKSICNAQKLINQSSAELASNSNLMFVVGGKHSSNTIELANNISKITKTIFLENIEEFESELKANNIILTKDTKIGLTAGASTERSELETLKIMLTEYIGDYNEHKN